MKLKVTKDKGSENKMVVQNKEIPYQRVYELAENALKMTPSTNSPKLFSKMKAKAGSSGSEGDEIRKIAGDLESAFYDAMINIELNHPDNEEDTRIHCVNELAKIIENNTGIKSEPDKLNRSKTSIPDYYFETLNNGVTTALVIEVKKTKTSLYTGRGNLKAGIAKQVDKYASDIANGKGFGLVILTNGQELAIILKGNIPRIKGKITDWQPLRNESVPILTMSCKCVSSEECKVLAYLIYYTLVGNYENIIKSVKTVYEAEVENLVSKLEAKNIKLIL